jgi:hypothetical protein
MALHPVEGAIMALCCWIVDFFSSEDLMGMLFLFLSLKSLDGDMGLMRDSHNVFGDIYILDLGASSYYPQISHFSIEVDPEGILG